MFVLAWLRNTDQPIMSYVWRALLIAFAPCIVIQLILPWESQAALNEPLILWFISGLVVAPWAETLLIWAILSILKSFLQGSVHVALASAAIWGVIHMKWVPGLLLLQMWVGFVFSLCFLAWEKKSKGRAILVTALVHSCFNIPPLAVGAILIGTR